MERNINKKYLNIEKKKDLPCGSMSIRNRFTYYPLYDVDKNSFIRRYQLWLKYKNKCKKEGRKFVNVKQYGQILNTFSKEICYYLSVDPDGVSFKDFKIKTFINKRGFPIVKMQSKLKKKGSFKVNNWGIMPNRLLLEKLKKLYKTNKLVNFAKGRIKHFRAIANNLDIFDDF